MQDQWQRLPGRCTFRCRNVVVVTRQAVLQLDDLLIIAV
jgi:hypothetical protein